MGSLRLRPATNETFLFIQGTSPRTTVNSPPYTIAIASTRYHVFIYMYVRTVFEFGGRGRGFGRTKRPPGAPLERSVAMISFMQFRFRATFSAARGHPIATLPSCASFTLFFLVTALQNPKELHEILNVTVWRARILSRWPGAICVSALGRNRCALL